MAIPAGLVLIAAFALSYSFKKGLALVLWVRIMQASDSTKLLFYPFAIKKFHNYVCFPLLLALHTLVTLFSFQGAVLTWSQIQPLVRTNAWIQIQRHVKFSLLPFFFKRKEVVGPSGLEPPTSRLSVVRSSQLSYGPVGRLRRAPSKLNNVKDTSPESLTLGRYHELFHPWKSP